MKLTVYGDFNCPFSYLASTRVDRILEHRVATIEWRAVEHDPCIPTAGQPLAGELGTDLKAEVADVRSRLHPSERVPLRVPRWRSNTRAATAALAKSSPDESHDVRRRLFRAVWAEGLDISDGDIVERITGVRVTDRLGRSAYWRQCWLGFERPVVPLVLLHTGYVARGVVALRCLRRLAFAGSLPRRPWADFRRDAASSPRTVRSGGIRN